mmetsp:Transcript_46688/g.123299  ORF Transcript_46688/g.123299 Transcript_46688/m.123299 type:complete len:216 (+) Transcript_46688:116-763(+)
MKAASVVPVHEAAVQDAKPEKLGWKMNPSRRSRRAAGIVSSSSTESEAHQIRVAFANDVAIRLKAHEAAVQHAKPEDLDHHPRRCSRRSTGRASTGRRVRRVSSIRDAIAFATDVAMRVKASLSYSSKSSSRTADTCSTTRTSRTEGFTFPTETSAGSGVSRGEAQGATARQGSGESDWDQNSELDVQEEWLRSCGRVKSQTVHALSKGTTSLQQ